MKAYILKQGYRSIDAVFVKGVTLQISIAEKWKASIPPGGKVYRYFKECEVME